MDNGAAGAYVLVTGASRGIGRKLSQELAESGYDIVMVYNSSNVEAEQARREIEDAGRSCITVRADLANSEGRAEVVNAVRERSIKLEAVVNNAGIYRGSRLYETSDSEWESVIALNLTAPFMLSRDLSKSVIDGGSIVNIASVYGFKSDPWAYPYQASKAALIHLTRGLAKELAPRLRVNAVAPGFIRTTMNEDAWSNDRFRARIEKMTPMGRWGETSDVVSAVRFLMERKNSFITGTTLVVDGGIGL